MEHGSRIIRSILDFASTDRCTKKRKGVVFLFFSEYLKDKKSIYKDYYRSINFFFLLICKCSSCKCLKKNLLSVILITPTNSFINLTIVFKTRFFEVGDQIDRKKTWEKYRNRNCKQRKIEIRNVLNKRPSTIIFNVELNRVDAFPRTGKLGRHWRRPLAGISAVQRRCSRSRDPLESSRSR